MLGGASPGLTLWSDQHRRLPVPDTTPHPAEPDPAHVVVWTAGAADQAGQSCPWRGALRVQEARRHIAHPPEEDTFGQVQLGGNRRLYQFLLSVCRLLYESSVVDEETGRTTFRDFRRDEATMWALFEEFVTGFYEREQSVYRVNPGGDPAPASCIPATSTSCSPM